MNHLSSHATRKSLKSQTTQLPPGLFLGRILTFCLLLLLFLPRPAYAYGDPTGGALFQILGPILALAWGAWMIFANGVRRRVSNLFHKMRGTKAPDPEP